jgi:hypothetical protein
MDLRQEMDFGQGRILNYAFEDCRRDCGITTYDIVFLNCLMYTLECVLNNVLGCG